MSDPARPPDGAESSASLDAPLAAECTYRLRFTRDALDPANGTLRALLAPGPAGTARLLAVVDQGVAAAWPGLGDRIAAFVGAASGELELVRAPLVVVGGERAKQDAAVVDAVLRAIHDGGLCRHSYVLAIGGGATLDAVGFAAATAHRGVRLVRLPTTTLGQGDAGIGVKNGINRFGVKNFLGAFAVPWAVVNDEIYLATLDERDWRGGWAEAVKVALLKDPELLEQIRALAPALERRDLAAASFVIRRSAHLHLDHILRGGDPFESRTARPLDFGHWAAHRLEEMTGFTVRHGEAVAIGLAIDIVYAAIAGLCPWRDAERALACLRDLGFALHHDALADLDGVLEGLEAFRAHLGGRLTVTLLRGIGRPEDVHELDRSTVAQAIDYLAGDAEERMALFAG